MDGNQFDRITMNLRSGTDRRTLGSLFAGVVAAFSLADPDEAWAAKSGKCKKLCTECETCKRGKCKKSKSDKKTCKKGTCQPKPAGIPCTVPAGGICQSGICACTGGLTNCSGTCVNTTSDEANCGTCDTACAGNQVCIEGLCWTLCPEASVCGAGGDIHPCISGGLCADVAGTPVCVQGVSCDTAIDCSSAPCPAGTACAAVCCGPTIDEHCLEPA